VRAAAGAEFAVLYSCSALAAVWTRSTVLCVVGCLLFWALCSAVNMARAGAVARGDGASPAARGAVEAAYWVLPKPVDLGLALQDALQTDRHFRPPADLQAYRASPAFSPGLAALTSLLFGAAVLALAARRLARTDC
jgi:hypothetical protein